jgi:hypothetical protein
MFDCTQIDRKPIPILSRTCDPQGYKHGMSRHSSLLANRIARRKSRKDTPSLGGILRVMIAGKQAAHGAGSNLLQRLFRD